MMKSIHNRNMLPAEQFSASGKTAIDGVKVKQIGFYDQANTLQFTSILASVDE
jgi:hypothetical protein